MDMNDLQLHGLVGDASSVKNTYSGITVIPYNSTTLNISIPTVDKDKSIVLINIYSNDTVNPTSDRFMVRADITTNTNIKLDRTSVSSNNNLNIAWTVIEFSNVKSVQKGTFSEIGGLGKIKTISTININKSVLFFSFSTIALTLPLCFVRGYISSSTQLTFDFITANNYVCNWQVVEFN